MKLKDIEVGKEYADSYGEKVTILETGLYGNVFHSGAFSTFRSEFAHYVKAQGPYGGPRLIHCRSIIHDWETQEKNDKEREEEASHGIAKVNYLWDVLEKYTHLKRRQHYPVTRIELNHKEVEEVCKCLIQADLDIDSF